MDEGSPSLSSTAVFTIVVEDANDNSPQFASGQLTSVTVREDRTPGEILLNISATDGDTGKIAMVVICDVGYEWS